MPFPVESNWITETETNLGALFPTSYVVAMAKMNGGSAEIGTDVFWLRQFMDKSNKKRIQRTCYSICRETASLRELEYFQDDLVAIGHNVGADALVWKPMVDDPTTLEHAA